MPDRALHTLRAMIRDYDGSVTWTAACPHNGRGDDRDCKWGEEAPDCKWELWDAGAHHPQCSGEHDCDAAACWGDERPDVCDGFYSDDAGHCHPIDACGLAESLGIGWEDAVCWSARSEGFPVDGPIPVVIRWVDGLCEVEPAALAATDGEAGGQP